MSIESSKGPLRGHLFTVDILIENDSNGRALERLLRLLNSPDVRDYRIKSGVELGKTIEAALRAEKQQQEAGKKEPAKKSADGTAKAAEGKSAAGKTDAKPAASASQQEPGHVSTLIDEIERYKANNTLVRITIMKGKGIKLSMPCRILNYDPSTQNVSIYHVDEKKVYLFRLNEIDELQAG